MRLAIIWTMLAKYADAYMCRSAGAEYNGQQLGVIFSRLDIYINKIDGVCWESYLPTYMYMYVGWIILCNGRMGKEIHNLHLQLNHTQV